MFKTINFVRAFGHAVAHIRANEKGDTAKAAKHYEKIESIYTPAK